MSLLHNTFGCNFCMKLLYVTFIRFFCMSLLDISLVETVFMLKALAASLPGGLMAQLMTHRHMGITPYRLHQPRGQVSVLKSVPQQILAHKRH